MGKVSEARSGSLKKVSVSLPFGLGSAEWEADSTERYAAWSLYVELVTRISVQPLHEDEGILREVLNRTYAKTPYITHDNFDKLQYNYVR